MKEIIDKIGIKKIIALSITIIGIIILTIIGALIYNKFFYKKSYSEIESIMINASENYYKDYPDKLPKESGDITNINVNTLIKKEYMKSFKDYLKDENTTCKGSVNLTKVNKEYRYTPIIDCGKKYKTKYLTDEIKNNNKIVTSKDGLYELNNELVFRGENPKNNISFAGYNWKIVKITEENKIIIIISEPINEQEAEVWDDRYNKDKEETSGINDYTVSRAYENLNKLYNSKKLFNSNDKLLISNYNLQIGKRKEEDKDKTGALEKSKILENQYIGLLPAYDYMNASLDINCTYTESYSCGNYNYLSKYDRSWWLLTGSANNSHEIYEGYDNIYVTEASREAYYRPVIAIVKDAVYESGKGTQKNPYKFK